MDAERVLITGGCGFIGRHLASSLRRRGRPVRILDLLTPQVHGPKPDTEWMERAGIEFFHASVSNAELCDRAMKGVATVYHLAAETGTGQSMYELQRYVETNITGTAVVLEACVRNGVERLVLASSRAVYGEGSWTCGSCGPVHPLARQVDGTTSRPSWLPDCPGCGRPVESVRPTPETETTTPISVYGLSKLTQEQLVALCREAGGPSARVLRLSNVYGPGQSLRNPYTGVLAVFVNRARTGRALEIYEDGGMVRDFVYVEDAVRAFELAAERDARGPLNVGSGVGTTVEEIARLLVKLTGSSSEIRMTGKTRLGDVRGVLSDVRRAAGALGWRPEVGLAEGLARFVRWAVESRGDDGYEESVAELERRGLYR